jgi:hypothetical protein
MNILGFSAIKCITAAYMYTRNENRARNLNLDLWLAFLSMMNILILANI